VSIMKRSIKLKAVDFFSGAGGLSYGLRNAGIEVLAGLDNDKSCKQTYETNNSPAVFLDQDISRYEPYKLERELGITRDDDNLIFAGCAPCQYWTVINTSKDKSLKSKDLILDFQRFVEYYRPGFIIVENVPGISSRKGSPMGSFIDVVETLGYNIAHGVTSMSEFGIPQRRRRFTLLASRVTKVTLPIAKQTELTVRDVLGEHNGFPRIQAGTRDNTVFMHTAAGLSKKNLTRLQMTKHDGGDRSKWQNIKKLELPCYANGNKIFYDTYGRIWWDKPAPTITTKFFSISNGRFAHPEENRALSLREGATLQSFPKKYRFVGSSVDSIAKMIGNAVPPKFAEILGRHIIKLSKLIED